MKNLVVCGDSWMSDCSRYVGTHFTDIVADKLNYKKISLACPGISNFGICVQIEKAISLNPDLVIIGNTCTDRFDFGLTYTDETMPNIDISELYVPGKTESYNQILNKTVISGNIGIMEKFLPRIDELKYQSFQSYLTKMYNTRLKTHQDHLMLCAVISQLFFNNIPFVLTYDFCNTYEGKTIWNWVPKKFDMRAIFHTQHDQIIIDSTTAYHTSPGMQKTLGDLVIDHITTYFN